ncbi:MAG: cytochrome c oxidase subunit II [Methylorubrum extorquens]|jgi:cytochrome c oxidase subunit 2|uniref:cytochrome-c oxidase n=1 Tax=Methylorubrum extorquens (strain DSM 6343 / CIP 106787 / DM4) TaxID=661410 RepID=C7C6M4_METED|nr:cytochrome c oxidase subunit II [Methylorubrum extorquens]CAX21778.1 putative Cytochrome c oxidase, subunit II (coxB-like) [Methylorubrum extorquens DM4]
MLDSLIPAFLRPESASVQAAKVDTIFVGLLLISSAIVLLVVGLVLTFAIRFRRGSPAKRGEMPSVVSREFEIGWTAATLFIFVFIFWWAASVEIVAFSPPKDAIEIHVVGKQWMWKTQGPSGTREINELHVPVGAPVRLLLTSQDVIHSFYVPAFRLKRDALPYQQTETWFQATKTGTYHLLCTEYCGTDHSRMLGRVIVMEPQDYAQWLTRQPERDGLAELGERLFSARGCSGCHNAGAKVHAPSLAGIWGQSVPLEGGRMASVDEAYIRDSILQPQRDVVAGYEPIMPSYEGKLSDGEIQALTAYIRHGTDRFDLIGSLNLVTAQNICAPGQTPQDGAANQTLRSPAMVPGAPASGETPQ